MDLEHSIAGLRARLAGRRAEGAHIGLIATMGGLHAGHLSLVTAARAAGDRPLVSIFVNPAQFENDEAFVTYPRKTEGDISALRGAGADLVFAPPVEEIYPPGFATRVSVTRHVDILCAQRRPWYFQGLAQIVVKLFNITGAETAYFGEKDWQQLQLVRSIAADLNFTTLTIACPTIRDADGLALSTRNAGLSVAERRIAPRLYNEIVEAARRIATGTPTELACAEAQENLIIAGFRGVDYLECRDGITLRLVPSPGRGARVFAAAWLGRERLIDNVPVPARG